MGNATAETTTERGGELALIFGIRIRVNGIVIVRGGWCVLAENRFSRAGISSSTVRGGNWVGCVLVGSRGNRADRRLGLSRWGKWGHNGWSCWSGDHGADLGLAHGSDGSKIVIDFLGSSTNGAEFPVLIREGSQGAVGYNGYSKTTFAEAGLEIRG